MSDPKKLAIKDFVYELPDERIAKFPLPERDQSKLLYYKSGTIADHTFTELPELLPADTLLVFNDTKVVQARLLFQKETGGIVEIFCLEPVKPHAEVQLAMQQTESCTWKCLVGNNKRWKSGKLYLHFEGGTITAEREAQQDGHFLISFAWEPANLTFAEVLERCGKLPLPPYLNRDLTPDDRTRYQTIYANQEGAVAAPTAGLHFTDKVMATIKAKGISTAYLTLHVGAGTFKPVKADVMEAHKMHAEQLYLTKDFIVQLLHQVQQNKPVIPVGTTSMRSLESLYWLGVKVHQQPDLPQNQLHITQWFAYETIDLPTPAEALNALLNYMANYKTDHLHASTQIIIAPGYSFRICIGLVTNFHQPESTLLLLVSALIGDNWRKVYQHAMNNNYRFLSYGDSSLLLP
ncbi:S-adenosylmethionine:tRNA ribosyltransferase-isomerase [Pontibacter sp. BT310]|uniref:S-adenosylmethionine:tRNA ribosyltransferase-isomerase n=1 Tax=Pontibacter populi TaxID=890055 RepID=A0ABS6X9E4_9BACT|nr:MULTISPECIES: S-adenosylmethionine:tRNA ribosyltransferase-isomerase [Pontibacter]MBJ6116947.1 S-adenosylmethionine:tRNA ribosyltransferase-isomerase [Pontibacter sp. BT310]MBR0569371.1 S-adenosylmethionine:tRNA ribosyltransferase-isomerase [Microvirga sp. STS03]MBW3363800.1 S-adenosylmethionine:tRNA ribosyltransferase-isomerase [Pontibacter populi]